MTNYRGNARNDMAQAAEANDDLLQDIARALGPKVAGQLPALERDALQIAREMRKVLDDVIPMLIERDCDQTMKQVVGTLLNELVNEFVAS
jgi:methylaspartate ammonia-lyase